MNLTKRIQTLFCACLLSASAPLALAHEESGNSATRAIEYRQSLMTVYLWNSKSMGDMVKGKVDYDQAAFARFAADLAAAASLDLLKGFPEDSEQGETDALPDIWLDFEGFKEKFEALRSAAKSLQKVAAEGDRKQTEAAYAEVGEACKSCHKAFKN